MAITERNKMQSEESFEEEDWLKDARQERKIDFHPVSGMYGDSYQETMNDELKGQWAGVKRICREDMGICGAVLFCNCAYDFYCNLLYWAGMRATSQPVSFGVEQMIVLTFFSMVLMRRWMEYENYK